MKKKLIGILLIFATLLISRQALAQNNVQYIDAIQSKQDILITKGDKLFLSKEWHSLAFEINPLNKLGKSALKQVDRSEYQKALEEADFPLGKAGEYKVYFLNYRLKDYPTALAISFRDDSVVVFGTYYIPEEKIHQTAVHELGHQVDFTLMDQAKWEEYMKLRGLTDRGIYNNSSSTYANRPQEVFAEDFRLLCGGEKARTNPHLNQDLPDPYKVMGLDEFFARLKGED